jgi:CheY-like chemotaxis protein
MKTVLVLEDNAAILALIRMAVESRGYAVLAATSAREAFERFEENDSVVDLLITDVKLPESSGIRVALELRSLLPYLKIIVTSGYSQTAWDEQDAAEFNELPSDSVSVLQKPFIPAELLDRVHMLIGLPLSAAPAF